MRRIILALARYWIMPLDTPRLDSPRAYVPDADASLTGQSLMGGVSLPAITLTDYNGVSKKLETCSPITDFPSDAEDAWAECAFDSSFPEVPDPSALAAVGPWGQRVRGDYYPVALWCDKATFQQHGVAFPRSERDFADTTQLSSVVFYDNIRGLTRDASDMLCAWRRDDAVGARSYRLEQHPREDRERSLCHEQSRGINALRLQQEGLLRASRINSWIGRTLCVVPYRLGVNVSCTVPTTRDLNTCRLKISFTQEIHMFSIKTLTSTLAAAGLVSVIGLAYAQSGGQSSSDPATTGSSTDSSIQSPSNQGTTTTLDNSTGTRGTTTTTPANSTGTQRSTMSSDSNLRADGSSELEARADRN